MWQDHKDGHACTVKGELSRDALTKAEERTYNLDQFGHTTLEGV